VSSSQPSLDTTAQLNVPSHNTEQSEMQAVQDEMQAVFSMMMKKMQQ